MFFKSTLKGRDRDNLFVREGKAGKRPYKDLNRVRLRHVATEHVHCHKPELSQLTTASSTTDVHPNRQRPEARRLLRGTCRKPCRHSQQCQASEDNRHRKAIGKYSATPTGSLSLSRFHPPPPPYTSVVTFTQLHSAIL